MKTNREKILHLLKRYILILIIACVSITSWTCYPDYGLNVEDFDVVATFYDKNFNFANVQTYAMPDTIVHYVDSTQQIVSISRQYDTQILSQIESKMNSLGYTREMNPQINGADVFILVGATASQNYKVYGGSSWWPYWGWYPGWGYWPIEQYGPGYGYWYPWWPGGSSYAYSYTTGTLAIAMVEPDSANHTNSTVPVRWIGAINGVTEGGVTLDRITEKINQCFSQSPYLGH